MCVAVLAEGFSNTFEFGWWRLAYVNTDIILIVLIHWPVNFSGHPFRAAMASRDADGWDAGRWHRHSWDAHACWSTSTGGWTGAAVELESQGSSSALGVWISSDRLVDSAHADEVWSREHWHCNSWEPHGDASVIVFL